MAHIPDEVVERLKSEVSLERLVGSCGIELKKHGADLLGLCLFHDAKEPSLSFFALIEPAVFGVMEPLF